MIENAISGLLPNQSVVVKLPMPVCVRIQLITPYWVSNIHFHTIAAVTDGITQAMTIPTETMVRSHGEIRRINSATSIPTTIVSPTLATTNRRLRTSAVQKKSLPKMYR